ncbi:MAG TPA: MMPL family transporter, partial [Candidatus Binataceae bacterium]|nr:MMPL family transporter [Candidatus Binataceae bacterium]
AVELAVVNTGTGVFASACIMALAFLMPMFTDFKGIAELGLVSAAGLFCCLVSALLIFPAMIALRDRNRPFGKPVVSMAPERSTLKKLFARPGLIVSLTVIATIGASVFARGVGFDQDLLKLQASDVEAVRFEKMLLRDSGRSSWFAVALAPTRKLAERQAARFRELTEVSDVETIGTYIPDRQEEKLKILAHLGAELPPIAIRSARPEDPTRLMRELRELDAKLRMIGRLDGSDATARTSGLVAKAVAKLQSEPNAFANYSRLAADSLDHELAALKLQLTGAAVTERNLPSVLRERFIGTSGQYLVQIYPKGDVWEDGPLERFITALRTVDRSVTGPPVQTYSIASVMRRGYERAAVLALIAVFVFVFADFRNLRDTLLATVPLVFGGAWLLETMGALGWEFNLANLFAVPIVIGMGVDNGVNMLYRWREERDKSSLILTRAVGKSVTICSLTTIAAFAALIPADHRGISSLGWILSLGTSFILLATLVVLPALFELVGSRIARVEEAERPPTAASSTEMREDKGEAAPRRIAGSTRA